MIIKEMWAKSSPYKTLLHHMVDTGLMCKVLLEKGTISPVLKKLIELMPDVSGKTIINTVSCIVALHDIGKCHPFFQSKDPSNEYMQQLYAEQKLSLKVNNTYYHEIGSKYILEELLNEYYDVVFMLSCILRLHHQRGAPGNEHYHIPEYLDIAFWENEQKLLYKRACEVFNPNFNIFKKSINLDATAVLIWGCMVLSDWLCSGHAEFNEIGENLDINEYIELSRVAAEKTLKSAGLDILKLMPAGSFCELWKEFKPESLRPLQKACVQMVSTWKSENVPGFILLEAPMGEGKTEAGLFLVAHLMKEIGKTGFYVALPTAATSNNMFSRIKKLLENHEITRAKLMHAQAWMIDGQAEFKGESDDENEAKAWLAPLRRAMLSQYAVGTVDQVMMSVMRIKYGVLRLTGVASKVIIIDEIHAYDAYMLTIIERLLNWCAELSVPVIILSATLPIERRNRLVSAYSGTELKSVTNAYPLITTAAFNGLNEIAVNDTYMKQTVKLSISGILGEWEQVAQQALEKVKSGGCICVLVNTVNEAQELYNILKNQKQSVDIDIEIMLFHARFPAKRRQEIEDKCLKLFGKEDKRPHAAILVATQVIEQSLDLDFDSMITAIAPIDLLLQRIGRLHRHADNPRPYGMEKPDVTVLIPKGDIKTTPTAGVYSPWILNQTIQTIKDTGEIHIPEDIRDLVESVYGKAPQENIDDEWIKLNIKTEILSESAKPVIYPKPNKDYFFAAEYQGNFYNEESNDLTYNGARTRMGNDSVRIALVKKEIALKADNADKSLAETIMSQTVSVSKNRLNNREHNPGYEPEIVGTGLLSGIIILPTDTGRYAFKKNGKDLVLYINNELGLIIEEG